VLGIDRPRLACNRRLVLPGLLPPLPLCVRQLFLADLLLQFAQLLLEGLLVLPTVAIAHATALADE
jgi:hypothetical protein